MNRDWLQKYPHHPRINFFQPKYHQSEWWILIKEQGDHYDKILNKLSRKQELITQSKLRIVDCCNVAEGFLSRADIDRMNILEVLNNSKS